MKEGGGVLLGMNISERVGIKTNGLGINIPKEAEEGKHTTSPGKSLKEINKIISEPNTRAQRQQRQSTSSPPKGTKTRRKGKGTAAENEAGSKDIWKDGCCCLDGTQRVQEELVLG